MAKVSPARTNFNAGEYSILVEGRTDLDKYPASMRSMKNFIAAPQGPALRRSGTAHVTSSYKDDKRSSLLPFVFSEEQAHQLEFSDFVCRFIFEEGIQAYDPVPVTTVTSTSPIKFDSSALGANVGDQVAFHGFDVASGLDDETWNVVAKVGTVYEIDVSAPGVTSSALTVQRIYSIVTPYAHADVHNIIALQSVDVVYLFCEGYRPRVLSRFNAYDWRLTTLDFKAGPFMPAEDKAGTLTFSGNGIAAGSAFCDGNPALDFPERAFDGNPDTYWTSSAGTNQTGVIGYHYTAPQIVRGYTVYIAKINDETAYSSTDHAPGSWTFEGSNDGTNYTILDTQKAYILYSAGRSVHLEINNDTAYTYYRLNISECTRNGPIRVSVAELTLTVGQVILEAYLSGDYSKLNDGLGFLPTDVGRHIRVKPNDQYARYMIIDSYVSSTQVNVRWLGERIIGPTRTLQWQFGYWSDTTGWPNRGAFFDDRLWLAGCAQFPNLLAGSRVGSYDDFTQRSPLDEVLDDSAIAVTLNSRKLSAIRWIESDERGLIVGTGSNEWVLGPASPNGAMSARNIKARQATSRGSYNVEPVKVDSQLLYVQGTGRTIREFAYRFDSDGYRSPSMSLFASHLGIQRFAQMQYASEPHSLVWFRREDGSVVCLTYNREESVIGWHQHDFGGVIESISCIPSVSDRQDTLWIVVVRAGRRSIERLVRFWDFNSDIDQAHFVDSGLRYVGPPITVLHGLRHLEGMTVSGLADGIPFEDIVVSGYKIELPYEASNVLVGLSYESFGEISRIEAGAADGTAQGKQKRIHNLTPFLWDSAYGEVGVYNEDREEYDFTDVEYEERFDVLEPIALQTQMIGPITMPAGYGKRGSVAFRQTKPLPFNVISLLPQLNTQDR